VNRVWQLAFLLIVATIAGGFLWITDFITLQGEWTVYTVACMQGEWSDDQCTGKLAASARYRFRALKPHKEVFFWVVGSTEPSGRYTQCEIKNRENWTCKANADSARTITLAMVGGHPVPDLDGNTRPFHAVSKVRWLLLKYGNVFG
jgi:hypothetical protein